MEEQEKGLYDYLLVIKKRWKTVALIAFTAMLTGGVISMFLPPIYKCESRVKIGMVRNKIIESYATIDDMLSQKPVIKKIAEVLKLPVKDRALEMLKSDFKTSQVADMLKIEAYAKSPEDALRLLETVEKELLTRHDRLYEENKAILQEYIIAGENDLKMLEEAIKDLKKKISRTAQAGSQAEGLITQGYIQSLDRATDRYLSAQQKLRDLKMEESYGTMKTKTDVPGYLPENRISPKRKQNVLISGILGLLLGVVWIFFIEWFEKEKVFVKPK